jgi:hypothetical protein
VLGLQAFNTTPGLLKYFCSSWLNSQMQNLQIQRTSCICHVIKPGGRRVVASNYTSRHHRRASKHEALSSNP